MSQIQVSFLPPEYWQDFQSLVLADAQREWSDATCLTYGRDGQSQEGIDVLVTRPGHGPIGIQAKKRRLYNAAGAIKVDGGLTNAEISGFVTEAEKFRPKLEHLIIATTALPDTGLQDHVVKLDANRTRKGKFSVSIWFWDHYQAVLHWNSDLQAIYYRDIATRTLDYNTDKHYLMMVRTAFNRPVYTTRLVDEDSGEDMVQALTDTSEAIRIGVLKDRNGQRVGRAPIGIDTFSGPAKANLEACLRFLDETRQRYRAGVQSGALNSDRRGVFPKGPDGKAAEREIDTLRGKAIDEANVAFQAAGLKPMDNYLSPRS